MNEKNFMHGLFIWIKPAEKRTNKMKSVFFKHKFSIFWIFAKSVLTFLRNRFCLPFVSLQKMLWGAFIRRLSNLKKIPVINYTLNQRYIKLKNIVTGLDWILGSKGAWRSGDSTPLPSMWPGFESWCRFYMWVKFVVGSLPCSERFPPGTPVVLSPLKNNTSKFQFDLECTDTFQDLKNSYKYFMGK